MVCTWGIGQYFVGILNVGACLPSGEVVWQIANVELVPAGMLGKIEIWEVARLTGVRLGLHSVR